MTAVIIERAPLARLAARPSHPVRLLQAYSITLTVLPGDFVVKVIGADGYAAALIAYLMFILWAAGALLGHHNPAAYRYRIRITLAGLWIASLASYALLNYSVLTSTQVVSAERWFEQLIALSGVILVAAEGLSGIEDVRCVLRALSWGGAVCGIVAVVQFKAKLDLTKFLKPPGFSINASAAKTAEIVARGGLNRVPGTGIDPIEMGVAMSMVLALSIYLLMYDKGKPLWRRLVPFLCISAGVATSISRSAVIAVIIAVGGLIVSLPPTRRLKGLACLPIAVCAVAIAAPGLLGTLTSFFVGASEDPSVTHRTDNYPYVIHLVEQAPWLGRGGGTYLPAFNTNTLDNQYLTLVIELGVVGLVAFILYLAYPAAVAFGARRRTNNQELRDLAAALGTSELAAIVTSGTFDSFSFPMFYGLQALIVGLIGTVWLIVSREQQFAHLEGGTTP